MATAPARQLNNKVCTRFDVPSSLVLVKQVVKEEKLLQILSFANIRLKTYHTGNEIVHRLLDKIQWSLKCAKPMNMFPSRL